MRADQQQEGQALPAEAPCEGHGADQPQQQRRRIPEQALVGADGQPQQRAHHAGGHRLRELRVGGVLDDVAGEQLDAAERSPVVDALPQQHQGQRDQRCQRHAQPLAGQAGAGLGRPASFVSYGQHQQRRNHCNADLLGDQGQAQGEASQGWPTQPPWLRPPVAQQRVDRQHIGQRCQRLAEERPAIGPGQRCERVDERTERGCAPVEAQLQEAEVDQGHGGGCDQDVEEHDALDGRAQGPPPEVEGNSQDLVDRELAALDEAVDAAEQGALVVALERADIGQRIDGQGQEEDANGHGPVLAARVGKHLVGVCARWHSMC